MFNKICLITGATSGIGRATALKLGEMGACLILVGRNTHKGHRILHYIKKRFHNDLTRFIKIDLSIKKQVHQLVNFIDKDYRQIDVLINNAGARFNSYRQNSDGIELTFATNHLSHFVLTLLLLNKLRMSDHARIINVSSGAHVNSSGDFASMLNHEIYDRKLAYANSKLANILFTYELSRRIKKTHIVANAVNPGGAATMIGINNGLLSWLRHIIYFLLKRKLLSPHKAAETIVFLATSSNLKCVTGKYYFQKVATKSSEISYNEDIAIDLWRLSVQMTGIQAYREYFDDIIELN